MNKQNWKRVKHILKEDDFPKGYKGAAVPFIDKIKNNILKVYFSSRDENNRSHIFWAAFNMANNFSLLDMSTKPEFNLGNVGEFDEDGSMGCQIFYKNNEKYHDAYFDKYSNVWCHGDYILKTENHGFIIFGRSDATLNPGGVRIGTAEIYRQVEQIEEVLEGLVVGQMWQGDTRVILFIRLEKSTDLTQDLIDKIKSKIRVGASPRHVPAKIIAVNDIPRTKSGKIAELAVRDLIHNKQINNQTIENNITNNEII